MKFAKSTVAVMLVVLSSLAVAQMNSGSKIVTQVPFQFTVANKVVPAGKCVIQANVTADGKTLLIRNAEGKVTLLSSFSRSETRENATNYQLVFNQYGDRYFLSGIRFEGSKITYRLPESKVERELQSQNMTPSEDNLVASLQ
jgi:putative cell wall-binding protein